MSYVAITWGNVGLGKENLWCGMDGGTEPPLLDLKFCLERRRLLKGIRPELGAKRLAEIRFTLVQERTFWWLQLITGQSGWLVDSPNGRMGTFMLSVLCVWDTM